MSKKERLIDRVRRDVRDLTVEQLDEVLEVIENATNELEDLDFAIHDILKSKAEDK